jgi:hypothetical protein
MPNRIGGWEPGELDEEIEAGYWLVSPAFFSGRDARPGLAFRE